MTAPVEDTVYAVVCPSCGWVGMSDTCKYGRCPWCGDRVKRERRVNEKETDSMGDPVAVATLLR